MTFQDTDFWNRMTPGMLDLGVGIFGSNAARKEADKRINAAQDPLYRQAIAGSSTALANAGSMDPKAAARERYNSAQALLSGQDAASEDQILRMLHSRGLLGVANYNPGVEGIAPGSTAMNPHMAAFYAARNARNAKMAYDSLNEGEQQIDRQLQRSAQLQQQANAGRQSNLGVQNVRPSKSSATTQILKGASSLLKQPEVLKGIGGLFGSGASWLNNFGNSFDPMKLDLSGIGDLAGGFDGFDW